MELKFYVVTTTATSCGECLVTILGYYCLRCVGRLLVYVLFECMTNDGMFSFIFLDSHLFFASMFMLFVYERLWFFIRLF